MKKKVSFISIIMVLSGMAGWLYEIIFYFINDNFNHIYLRGICFGPWIDIYALGGLLIYLLNKNNKKWYKTFIISGVSCGILEYLAGLLIFVLFNGKRSWNYNTEILNFGSINGYVCLRSVLIFALGGVLLIHVIVPIINKLLNSKYKNLLVNIFTILGIIFMLDEIYNLLAYFKIFNLIGAGAFYKKHGFHYWIS